MWFPVVEFDRFLLRYVPCWPTITVIILFIIKFQSFSCVINCVPYLLISVEKTTRLFNYWIDVRKSVLSIPLLISDCLCIEFKNGGFHLSLPLLYSEVPISYLTNWVDCNQQGAILSHIESNCMAHNFIGKNCSCLVILLKQWYQQEGFKNMYGLFVSDILWQRYQNSGWKQFCYLIWSLVP